MAGRGSGRRDIELVPRLRDQGYDPDQVAERRRWLESRAGVRLERVGATALDTQAMRGNVENPVGAAQVPLGVAGPLLLAGEHANDTVYVPLATTEGALVRSYERGMVAISRAGGAVTRLERDENRVAPIFRFQDVAAAASFARKLPDYVEPLRREAEATTRHGRLLAVEPLQVGRQVIVTFRYSTADAQGMNMIVRATERAARWLAEEAGVEGLLTFSGFAGEKRASGANLLGGKGKRVTAGARLPRRLVSAMLRVSPQQMVDLWSQTVVGHIAAGTLGYNGHVANGLAALFIACGQDVANVTNASLAMTRFETTPEGDLYASVTLPSLTVATVGGGTEQGTASECLQLLGCLGPGKAPRFAEIVAATVLAGEISFGAAVASGELVAAHELYGRNRPTDG